MAKTKAELLQENKELKAKLHGFRSANQTLGKRLKELQDKCQDLEFKAKGFQFAINGMQKEGDKLYQEKVALKDQLIKQEAKLNDAEEALEILQAEVRKFQINEEVIQDHAYDEGYKEAKRTYSQALQARESQIDSLIDDLDRLSWIIGQIHENQTK